MLSLELFFGFFSFWGALNECFGTFSTVIFVVVVVVVVVVVFVVVVLVVVVVQCKRKTETSWSLTANGCIYELKKARPFFSEEKTSSC